MFISKDPRGIYYIYYKGTDGKTKRKSTGARHKGDALTFFRNFNPELKPAFQEQNIISISIKDFREKFEAYANTAFAKNNLGVYRRAFDHFVRLFGDIDLNSITAQHWDLFKSNRIKDVSAVTVNIELRTLKAILNTALRWELIKKNAFSKQKLFSIPEQYPVFLTIEEFKFLYQTVQEQWFKDVLMIAVSTGMRRGELCNLQWKDIDLNRKIIIVQSGDTFKTKQGRNRIIPMNDIAFEIFQRLFGKKQIKKYNHDYVFISCRHHIFPLTLSKKFKEYVILAKMNNQKLHFHSLRHTFASWLVQSNTSLYEVQKLLGHSDSKTTQVYSHLLPDKMHSTVNKISIHLN